jgi:hypothetical protein
LTKGRKSKVVFKTGHRPQAQRITKCLKLREDLKEWKSQERKFHETVYLVQNIKCRIDIVVCGKILD